MEHADVTKNSGRETDSYDVQAFLARIDAMKANGASPSSIDELLEAAMADAENAGDDAALLTILNEAMGVYRVQSKHDENQWVIQRALELALRMGLEGTPQWAMTLVNAANAQRFAGNYDQASDLYEQAIAAYQKCFGNDSPQTAELRNNYALLLTDLGSYAQAETELRSVIRALRASQPEHETEAVDDEQSHESDIATSLVNLAHVLMDEAQEAAGPTPAQTVRVREVTKKRKNGKKAKATQQVQVSATPALETIDTDAPELAEKLAEADEIAQRARLSYEKSGNTSSPHYAAALCAFARVRFMQGDFETAADTYDKALAIIGACYGNDSDSYKSTHANFEAAIAAVNEKGRTGQTTASIAEDELENTALEATGHDIEDGGDTVDFGDRTTFPEVEGDYPAHANGTKETFEFPSTEDDSGDAAPSLSFETDDDVENASDTLSTVENVGNMFSTEESTNPQSDNATESTAAGKSTAASKSIKPKNGLDLAEQYWTDVVKPMIERDYPEYLPRIAAGLVGHGSECYGFDDEISRDHDFGPGCCLWLTKDDYQAIGKQLQSSYDQLPKTFAGFDARQETARADSTNAATRRVGVFEIGDFYESLTGYRTAPAETKPYEWLMLSEETLAAATNGRVFADPLGEFSSIRNTFLRMPDDVRLSLISRRLGMMSQAGQVNFQRMINRNDGAAAWTCLDEFAKATASLVFLLNNPVTVGYLPYYKWRFAALRRIADRMGMVLRDVPESLEQILKLAGTACFSGPNTFHADAHESSLQQQSIGSITELIDGIADEVVAVLQHNGLTVGDETFLEWQRPYVEEHIRSNDPCLKSL